MEKKNVLVVGSSGGVGASVAESMKERGMEVYGTYFSSNSVKEGSSYRMDVTDTSSVDSTLQEILKRSKTLDVVVFSVSSPIQNKHILNTDWSEITKHFDSQVKGLYNIVKSLGPLIQSKHKIKFVIILTEYCLGRPPVGISPYIIAKYGLMGFCKSLAVELSRYGSTVNMVSPGVMETRLTSNLPKKLFEISSEGNPLKRIATVKDVANTVIFLASDESDYLNGVNIPLNGGGVMQ